MRTVEQLETLIKQASAAYYDSDTPIMEDAEFDALVEELREIDPSNPLINKVGFGSDEISHANDTRIPIEIRVSLPKYKFNNLKNSLPEWVKSMVGYRFSPKLDGMSVIITYENKTLKSMISRGNGEFGMDLTSRFLPLIKSGKFDIPYTSSKDGTIRGELFIKKSVFDENLVDDYANPRNATSGIVNSDSLDNKQFISFLQHPQFEDIGLPIAPSNGISFKLFHLDEFIQEIESFYKLQLNADYPIDGIVIDKYDEDKQLSDSIAVKFPTESVETTVRYVEWNLSPRGRYIPVVVFEPVQLYGTEVERATGLHYSYIKDNKIGRGAIIKVTKANEIIPQITEVVKPAIDSHMNFPKSFVLKGLHAVECLETADEWYQHFSNNLLYRSLSRRGLKYGSLTKIFEVLQIHNAQNLVEELDAVRETPSSYKEIYIREFGNSTGTLFFDSIKEFKLEIREFLRTLGVDGVGSAITESLRDNKELVKYLREENSNNVAQLPVPSNVREVLSIPAVHSALCRIFMMLLEYIIPDSVVEKVENTNTKVCLSGKFPNYTKAKLIEEFADKWNLVDSLDKDCKYLVVPTLDRVSSKVDKAKKWGIEIIDFNTFLQYNERK